MSLFAIMAVPLASAGAISIKGATSVVFPAQAVGTTSGAVVVTLSNNTGSSSSISISGDFAQTNGCGSSWYWCTILVTFSPTATGTRSGTITVADDTGDSADVQLSGLGIPPGAGATTTAITAVGSSGNYDLTGTVVGTHASDFPTGTVSFVDTSNSNFSLGKSSFGTAKIDLTLTNAPVVVQNLPARSLVSADFNGDGKPDLAVLTCDQGCPSFTSGVWIALGNGDGTFTAPSSQPSVPLGGSELVVGDFNGDGKTDLFVFGGSSGNTVLFGNGDGTFTSQSIAIPGVCSDGCSAAVAVGDFNKDGKSDLVLYTSTGTYPNYTYSVSVLYELATGAFGTGPTISSGVGEVTAGGIVVGDFNGDGNSDFAIIDWNSSNSQVQVFLGYGDGTFRSPPSSTMPPSFWPMGVGYHSFATGDFNGDGKTDLVIEGAIHNGMIATSDGYDVLIGKGDGTFMAAPPIAISNSPAGGRSNSGSVVVADFNKDGRDDVIVLNDNVVEVELGNGDGTFTASTHVDSGAETDPDWLALVAGDFNGDGMTDFLALNSDAATITLEQAQRIETAVAILSSAWVPGTGTHNVEAVYAGDANFAPSKSDTTPLTAAPVHTTPAVTLAPASLKFPSQAIGSASSAQSVTLTNSGSAALSITSIVASGDFAETNTCGTSLGPGSNCTISVSFTPSTSGNRTGTISISDNAVGAPQSIALSGTGPSFTLTTLGSGGMTITSAGGSATATLQVAPVSGFSGAVNLTCVVAYQGTGTAKAPPTCSLNPISVTINGTTAQTATLTVSTTAATTAENQLKKVLWPAGGAALASLLFFAVPRRRNWLGMLAVLALLVSLGTLGCGGGGGTMGGGGGGANSGTTPGGYTITVSGTSGAISTAVGTVALTVQ